jgi:hypothetical protein
MYSTNEEVFEVFLTSTKGKELVQAARKVKRRSTSFIRPKWSFDLILEPTNMMMVYVSC